MTDFYHSSPDEQARRMRAAGRSALAHWDIEDATLELIKYRENAVFRIQRPGAAPLALRVHRHEYHSDAALKSELLWIEALQTAGVDTPKIIPTNAGDPFVNVEMAGLPGAMQIDLFEWIDGEQLGSVEEGVAAEPAQVREIYTTIGALAARVHNQASAWTPPTGFTRHAWDAAGLAGEDPFWGRFWELEVAGPARRDLLLQLRKRVFDELSAQSQVPDRYSMIHADFVAENLLVDGKTIRLIDFDDAGYGWHLFELATSLYFIVDEPYFETAKAALIEGYRQQRALSDDELEQLPLFFLARACTYLGWVHTRAETETARELTPMLLDSACALAESYLSR